MSLQEILKVITEEEAEKLRSQFGGLRLSTAERVRQLRETIERLQQADRNKKDGSKDA